MWSFLQTITKKLTLVIPTMMALGFLYGISAEAGWLKAMIIPFTFLMVYPMMVTLNIKKVFEGGDIKAQGITLGVNFLFTPFLAWGMGLAFFADKPYMALGLLLAGLVPTSGMTISWTGFAKGNMAAAVKMTVVGLVAGSLATPFYVRALMGAAIEVDVTAVFSEIFFIVFLAMTLGFITQRLLVRKFGQEHFQKRLGPRFPALSTIGVLGIVFVALALKARTIAASPELLLTILLPLVLLYGINFTISTVIGKRLLSRGDAIAMVYGTVMRNLSIALAIAMNAFGEKGADAALVVAAAYIIQVQSAAWYVKLTPRLFGPAAATSAPA
ncbi:MAG: arsenic resistance protein [Proteobacteria bacterium]|nr:arsenic resistance protein [Pseudomonadota bacterium]